MATSLVPTLTLTTPKTAVKTNFRPTIRARRMVVCMASSPWTPPNISEKVSESIKAAEETCADTDPQGGECAAAWDEVEELSAAASHARDKRKESDPLEEYCKDNPESVECRTYDN